MIGAEVGSVYCDVDGCLVLWPGKPGRVPRPGEVGHGLPPAANAALVEELRAWKQVRPSGHLTLWSRGGAEHARTQAQVCGIVALVDAFAPKPDLVLDDCPDQALRHAQFERRPA